MLGNVPKIVALDDDIALPQHGHPRKSLANRTISS
jgi:hypothetical protein